MNNFLSSIIYKLGAKSRNPSLFNIYREFKKSEKLSLSELEDKRFSKLKGLLIFAYKYSPYYKELFDSVAFNPEQFSDISEMQKIPATDKSILISQNEHIHSNFNFKKVRKAITSGTSGESLSFMRSEEWDSANRAGVMRGYSWYGVRVSDKNGYFWGFNIDQSASRKVRWLDWAQNRYRLFQYTDKEIREFCKKIDNASYLSGYSSMIYKVAREVNRLGLNFKNVKMVKGTSEMILPKYQGEVRQAFGVKMISEYGAAETGLIAFECPHGNQHINTDAVFVETDENNEILVTNLFSHSFPIIRYRLGDIVTFSEETCTCGMKSPLIKDIVGRKGTNVMGNSQEYPSFTFYYVFKNLALEDDINLNYKAYQKVKGQVLMQIEGKFDASVESAINKHLNQYFGSDVTFDIEYLSEFSSERKKQQSFVSYLS